jgi:hypothetical protein
MKNIHRALFLAGGLALVSGMAAPPAGAQVRIQFRFGTTDRPLEGRRYQTMRALAHYLDEEAWEASNQANEMVSYSPRTQRVVASIDDFAQQVSSFHDRMDSYQTRPWDLPNEVTQLDLTARRVNRDIRRSRAWSPVYDQWNNVLVALDRMKQVLAGNEVVVPQPHRRWGDWNRDMGPFVSGYTPNGDRDRREAGNYQPGNYQAQPGYQPQPGNDQPGNPTGNPNVQGNTLYGRNLDEFRNEARQLDQTMARALENGQRSGRRDDRLLDDMQRLNDEVSGLWQTVSTQPVSPSQWSSTIQGYLSQARSIQQGLQRTNAMPEARGDVDRAVDELARMQQVLGY